MSKKKPKELPKIITATRLKYSIGGKARQGTCKKIVIKLAEQYNMPTQLIEAIIDYPFRCLVQSMREATKGKIETFKNYMVRYLGTFVASPKRLYISEKYAKPKIKNYANTTI